MPEVQRFSDLQHKVKKPRPPHSFKDNVVLLSFPNPPSPLRKVVRSHSPSQPTDANDQTSSAPRVISRQLKPSETPITPTIVQAYDEQTPSTNFDHHLLPSSIDDLPYFKHTPANQVAAVKLSHRPSDKKSKAVMSCWQASRSAATKGIIQWRRNPRFKYCKADNSWSLIKQGAATGENDLELQEVIKVAFSEEPDQSGSGLMDEDSLAKYEGKLRKRISDDETESDAQTSGKRRCSLDAGIKEEVDGSIGNDEGDRRGERKDEVADCEGVLTLSRAIVAK